MRAYVDSLRGRVAILVAERHPIVADRRAVRRFHRVGVARRALLRAVIELAVVIAGDLDLDRRRILLNDQRAGDRDLIVPGRVFAVAADGARVAAIQRRVRADFRALDLHVRQRKRLARNNARRRGRRSRVLRRQNERLLAARVHLLRRRRNRDRTRGDVHGRGGGQGVRRAVDRNRALYVHDMLAHVGEVGLRRCILAVLRRGVGDIAQLQQVAHLGCVFFAQIRTFADKFDVLQRMRLTVIDALVAFRCNRRPQRVQRVVLIFILTIGGSVIREPD